MTFSQTDRFVRLPTDLLEAVLLSKVTGVQARILLWVTRHTYGWNRSFTPFTWYQIAKALSVDRAVIYRAAHKLLQGQMLHLQDGELGIQLDYELWGLFQKPQNAASRQLWLGISVVRQQRQALSCNNAGVVPRQLNRCPATTLFRRTKDRCKDKLKTYKDRHAPTGGDASHRTGTTDPRRHLAGAAKPIPGKYDSLSQN